MVFINNEGLPFDITDNILTNEILMNELSQQIKYYFSSQNLVSDVYMNTIMKRNSGFVPVSTLVKFGKVNHIISKHSEGLSIATLDLQKILLNSIVGSSELDVVLLDSNGEYLADYGDCEFESSASSHEIGIGFKISKKYSHEYFDDKKSNVVILRDVPEGATEVDVKKIFMDNDGNGPLIENIRKEVGRCWFVSISSVTSQSNIVSLLLDLRSKTILGETIKPRLKTQSSIARPFYPVSSGLNSYLTGSKVDNVSKSNEYYSKSGERSSYPKKSARKLCLKQRKTADSHELNIRKQESYVNIPTPDLDETQFPVLLSLNIDESKMKPKSYISTATGYASALLRSSREVQKDSETKPNTNCTKTSAMSSCGDEKSATSISTDDSSTSSKSTTVQKSECDNSIVPPNMAWGGRSFAEIVKR